MTSSADIRAQLSHPVIDADGHWLEQVPIFLDFLKTEGGSAMEKNNRPIPTPAENNIANHEKFENSGRKSLLQRRMLPYRLHFK